MRRRTVLGRSSSRPVGSRARSHGDMSRTIVAKRLVPRSEGRGHTLGMTTGELSEWRDGTVAILSTISGGMPHAIPVSTAVRAGPRRLLFALAYSRGSLARLRADPRAALSLIGAGDIAFTVRGRAAVVVESLEGVENVAAVALDVEQIDDHARAEFEILDGVRWRWLDESAQRRDRQVRAALRALASEQCTR